MFIVTEKVFENDKLIHESEQKWDLKSQFINRFKKLAGVSSHSVCDLNKNNRVELELDGLKRVIEITPKIDLGVSK
jgi:hypothetical protein